MLQEEKDSTLFTCILAVMYFIRYCRTHHRWHHAYRIYFQSLGTIASRLQTYFHISIWPVQGRAERVRHLAEKKQWRSERAGFCLKAQRNLFFFCLSAFSHIKWSLFCSRGCSDGGRERWMDPPSTVTFISHLLRCEEDTSEPREVNWGFFFLWDADWGEGDNDDFSHAIKAVFTSAGLFPSLRATNKYLIVARRCEAADLQPTWRVTVTVSITEHLGRSSHGSYLQFPNVALSHLHLSSWSCFGSSPADSQRYFKYDPDLFLSEEPHAAYEPPLVCS